LIERTVNQYNKVSNEIKVPYTGHVNVQI